MGIRPKREWIWKMAVWFAVIIFTLSTVFSGCSIKEGKTTPKAEGGTLDLRNWNWEQGVVPLSGEWRFEFLPQYGGPSAKSAAIVPVPGMWDGIRSTEGQTFPGTGYAVYELTVLHRPENGFFSIRVPSIATAYELYLNGKKVLERGKPAPDASVAKPYQMPATVYLTESLSRTDIRLVVANYHHRHGGIRTDLILGTAEQIDRLEYRRSALDLIPFGCLAMIGFYHIGLFVLRRKEKANLFFALLCLFVALRMGLIGEGFLLRWLEWLDWSTALRIEYISFVLSVWAGMAYYRQMYPREIPKVWAGVSNVAAALLAGSVVVLPTLRFTSLLSIYQVYLFTVSIFIIAALIRSGIRKREDAGIALIGFGGMLLAVTNDVLFYNGWWRSVDLVPFGLLFLILMNSFMIALRSSRTYDRAERLSSELRQWNDKLEGRIAARTEELRKSNETLEDAKNRLERMELSRRQLVSNISHDLRTPITLLQGYLEALRDGVISDEGQRASTIRLMLEKVEGLSGLIQDLFELSVLEAGRVELSRVRVNLEQWRDRLEEQYSRDLQEKGISFSCRLGGETDRDKTVELDARRMDRVFANLIYNAVRYTPGGGMIRITLRSLHQEGVAEIIVEDSGSGIHPDDLPYIFDRFYKKDKSRHSSSGGSGLGLAICREIVGLHGGAIHAFNRPEGGSAFRFVIPLSKQHK